MTFVWSTGVKMTVRVDGGASMDTIVLLVEDSDLAFRNRFFAFLEITVLKPSSSVVILSASEKSGACCPGVKESRVILAAGVNDPSSFVNSPSIDVDGGLVASAWNIATGSVVLFTGAGGGWSPTPEGMPGPRSVDSDLGARSYGF